MDKKSILSCEFATQQKKKTRNIFAVSTYTHLIKVIKYFITL